MLSVLRGVVADEVGTAFLELLEALATEKPRGSAASTAASSRCSPTRPSCPPSRSSATPGRTTCSTASWRPRRRSAAKPSGPARTGSANRCWSRSGATSAHSRRSTPWTRRASPAPPPTPPTPSRTTSGCPGTASSRSPTAPASSPRPASPSRSGSPPRMTGRAGRALAEHYARIGAGLFGRYRAFRWVREDGHGLGTATSSASLARPDPPGPARRLRPRARPRPPEHRAVPGRLPRQQRAALRRPRHRQVLHRQGAPQRARRARPAPRRGLQRRPRRLPLDHPAAPRPPGRFILFVDDLSFDEGERDYRGLKAVLEGSVEARPSNVVLYATSNRRHLVQERWTDRESTLSAEVHGQDTMQEKLSLSDRFGIGSSSPRRTSGATSRSSSRWLPSAASPSIPRCSADGPPVGRVAQRPERAHRAPVRRSPGRRAGMAPRRP